ncbi:hypothetical protein H1R20_g12733, partial [Candolleomyces eurysporus]
MGSRRPSCAGSGWPKLTLAAEGQPYWASRTGTWYAAQHPDVSNIHYPLYDEGIKRAGAAQILLTAAEAFDYTLANRLRPPNRASALRPEDFESLSPITFATADELKKKLKSLSKDNNPYRDQNRDAGFARGQFELNRARLGIDKVPRDGEWGAAHDVRLLVEIWKAMASGPIIDEQRATWPSRAASAASMRNAQLAPAPGLGEEDEDFDPEEMDPNDYRPQASSVPAAATGQAAWGAEDESDYDSDEY